MADIPGLVEGASEGVGLGHDFLRHVERTRDAHPRARHLRQRRAAIRVEDYHAIMRELEAYGDLKNRPMLIAANKTDLPGAEENLERLRDRLLHRRCSIFPVSAATRKGFEPLLHAAADLLDRLPARRAVLRGGTARRAIGEEGFTVERGRRGLRRLRRARWTTSSAR